MKGFVWLALAGMLGLGSAWISGKKEGRADLVLLGGTVWTAEPESPWAEAVAVSGRTISAVGKTSEIRELAGTDTRVVDLAGAFVLPGFIDSHTHFCESGFALSSVHLKDADSKQEFIRRVHQKVQTVEKGAWILHGFWDHQRFHPPELPRKEWIDGITPENPVCLHRHDAHMALANSLALKMAGITKETPSPEGGEIVREPDSGEPTGILRDAAIDLVTRVIPEPSLEERMDAARAALREANRFGVTSVHDMADAASFKAYQSLHRQGELTARIAVYIPIARLAHLSELGIISSSGNEFVKIAGLKGFVDGSLGSSTALFFDPYADDPTTSGLLAADMFPEGIMEERLAMAEKSGLQVALHAIGDRANCLVLDMFERVIAASGKRDRRWRIEHAQHLRPEDIPRFASLGIIASVQPYHAIDDGCWAEAKIGKKRAETTYAFRSLLATGATLACGSDWSVAPLNPLTGIYAAVTRRTLDGKRPEGWIPEEKISLDQALRGYTWNAAYAEFAEEVKGSVKRGKWADLVVLDKNLFEIPPEGIQGSEVLMTIIAGKVVYEK